MPIRHGAIFTNCDWNNQPKSTAKHVSSFKGKETPKIDSTLGGLGALSDHQRVSMLVEKNELTSNELQSFEPFVSSN